MQMKIKGTVLHLFKYYINKVQKVLAYTVFTVANLTGAIDCVCEEYAVIIG
jgi:hypothetical protein